MWQRVNIPKRFHCFDHLRYWLENAGFKYDDDTMDTSYRNDDDSTIFFWRMK